MAHIKSINFSSVSDNEGCTCDRCGQYIKNIWTVTYTEGLVMNYGIDCFEKVHKAGLNAAGKKLMSRTISFIKSYEERLTAWMNGEITEESEEWRNHWADWNSNSYWYGRDFEEYKNWMITEFLPYRIQDKQKELEKFKKVNFTI